jgi:hypothetical protein
VFYKKKIGFYQCLNLYVCGKHDFWSHLTPPPPISTYASDYREFLSNVEMSKLSRNDERGRGVGAVDERKCEKDGVDEHESIQ